MEGKWPSWGGGVGIGPGGGFMCETNSRAWRRRAVDVRRMLKAGRMPACAGVGWEWPRKQGRTDLERTSSFSTFGSQP